MLVEVEKCWISSYSEKLPEIWPGCWISTHGIRIIAPERFWVTKLAYKDTIETVKIERFFLGTKWEQQKVKRSFRERTEESFLYWRISYFDGVDIDIVPNKGLISAIKKERNATQAG